MCDENARIHSESMINVTNLTKHYGETVAVNDLTFTVRPGIVTGFLGPNGAGKSTTMRMILGLDQPTSGQAIVNGRRLSDHAAPLTEIGALLEAKAVHPKRSARNHLTALAITNGIPVSRVDESLRLVGLTDVADKAAGGFSLGMSQRLGIASALLGDPEVVMLDEPVNGLDPEGVLWIRHLLQDLAAEGRTVLVSSHLMSEMALTAQHFVIIGRGELIADVDLAELMAMAPQASVTVRTADHLQLRNLLSNDGVTISTSNDDCLTITGIDIETVGQVAHDHHIALRELSSQTASLEDIFMSLTAGAVDYDAQRLAA